MDKQQFERAPLSRSTTARSRSAHLSSDAATYVLRADTPAWIGQAWGFFGAAILFDCLAILWLPLAPGIKWLLLLVVVLTIYVCFALSKMIRDNRDGQVDTGPWILLTWLVSAVALAGLVGGIYYLTDDWKMRMIVTGGLAWAIESSLVLSKTIRDNEDARQSSDVQAETMISAVAGTAVEQPGVVPTQPIGR